MKDPAREVPMPSAGRGVLHCAGPVVVRQQSGSPAQDAPRRERQSGWLFGMPFGTRDAGLRHGHPPRLPFEGADF